MNVAELAMIVVTIVVVGLFLLYQVGMSRRRARESLARRSVPGRKRSTPLVGQDQQIDQLRRLRASGKIDDATYYEVLRKLTFGQRGR